MRIGSETTPGEVFAPGAHQAHVVGVHVLDIDPCAHRIGLQCQPVLGQFLIEVTEHDLGLVVAGFHFRSAELGQEHVGTPIGLPEDMGGIAGELMILAHHMVGDHRHLAVGQRRLADQGDGAKIIALRSHQGTGIQIRPLIHQIAGKEPAHEGGFPGDPQLGKSPLVGDLQAPKLLGHRLVFHGMQHQRVLVCTCVTSKDGDTRVAADVLEAELTVVHRGGPMLATSTAVRQGIA